MLISLSDKEKIENSLVKKKFILAPQGNSFTYKTKE